MYECPNCGGNLKFDIPSQQLACVFCGTYKSPYEVKKETDAVEQGYFETTVFTCPQCGGELLSEDNEATSFCSFCGASTILSSRISKEKRPKYIIPFKKTKADCKAAYEKKMRKAYFMPDELRDARFINGFRGIYMPYWTYQLTQNGPVTFQGETSHRSGNYVITNHYDLKGNLDAYYLGYSRDASSSFYDNISEALAPYDAKELVNFEPSFLSGFYADTADVGEEVYLEDVKTLADNSSYDEICKLPAFKEYGVGSEKNRVNLRGKMRTVCKSADSTMYPVWFLSYRNGDRVAYATVNGQTGKVVADMPIDNRKYVLSSLILAVPLFVLLNLFFTFKPSIILAISCLLVLISARIYSSELEAIWRKENNADDEGMRASGKTEALYGQEDVRTKKYEKKTGNLLSRLKKNISLIIILLFSAGPSIIGLSVLMLWPLILIGTIICCVIGMGNRRRVDGLKGSPGFVISMIVVGIAMFIRVWDPASDLYYYGGTLLSLLAVLFNMVDVIRNYNRLAMRRLPQFDKKGGDDRA